ncbi:acyl-CoA carboxylase epsilon subunit [Sanguibacter sp. 25GB23B1]|uniref:acyl-CoA carboxylase epsilon subunit n=1 Tax=unclassified Sanguibacter TaxID=2645534 RepID=UPI0032AF655C
MNGPRSSTDAAAQASPADVRVVRGAPDDMELAALVAGLVAAASGTLHAEEPVRSAWSDRSRSLPGVRATPSRDAWRWSLRS